jgi:hypothetical protein
MLLFAVPDSRNILIAAKNAASLLCGANAIEISRGEYWHLFEPIEGALTGHREIVKYSSLGALRQSNARGNHIEDRRAFVLRQSGLWPRRTNVYCDGPISINRTFLFPALKPQIEMNLIIPPCYLEGAI